MKNKFGVEYHLVDICNLNCAGCSHYSSLIDDKIYISLNFIVKDLQLLKDKVGDNLKWLKLLGGEPLLHPNINECLIEIRNLFPNTKIFVVTNGILLKKMNKEFYDTCLNYKIEICITDYGIIKDLPIIMNKLNNYGIKTRYYKIPKIWRYQHIRLTNERIDCLTKCNFKNMCNNYRNGKFYLCPHIAYIEYFNKYFNKNIELNETDYIDLNNIKSFDELIEKIEIAKPNFCYQYCNYFGKGHPIIGKWEKTKKDINEFCLIENN